MGRRLRFRGYLGFELLGRDDIWYRLPDSALKQLDPIVVAKYLRGQPPTIGSVSPVPHPPNGAQIRQSSQPHSLRPDGANERTPWPPYGTPSNDRDAPVGKS